MNKIRGNVIGTTQKPESALLAAMNLTETQKDKVRDNIGASSAIEVEDARIGRDGAKYETLGDAIRAQGVGIEVERPENLGENLLRQDTWRALPEGEVVSADNGVIVVSHNECYGDYLEQIQESTITPHVGYYMYRNFDELTDENPAEAVYLTDAVVSSRSYVKGATLECDFSRVTPAAVLELERPARIGRVDIICRDLDGVPTEFDIQVKTLSGQWETVKSGKPEDELFTSGQFYQNFIFDPVVGTAVRILIYDCYGNFPKILEITLHEVKSGRLIKRIIPDSYATEVDLRAPNKDLVGSLATTQDGDRYGSYCQAWSFTIPDYEEVPDDAHVDPVPMSGLSAPEFGYYTNGTTGDITPYYLSGKEPKYLVDGSSSTQTRSDYYLHEDITTNAKTPVILFNLGESKVLTSIVIEGYEYQRYNMEDFDIQVSNTTDIDNWTTVATVTDAFRDGTKGNAVAPMTIDLGGVSANKIRILIKGITDMSAEGDGSDDDAELLVGGYFRIKEITLYEVPKYVKKDNPIPFEFRFNKEVVINRFRIFAYHNQKYTPTEVYLTAEVDGEWIDIYGSTNPASGEKYEAKEIYKEGFTDTFVDNLDKDYRVSAIRLYIADRIGGRDVDGQVILNEIEFYGPTSSEPKETSIGVTYDEYDMNLAQKAGDVWYFSAKVSGEKYKNGSSLNRPEVVLEADVSGERTELCSSMTVSESLEDYYCTFTIPEDYPGLFTNLSVKVQYPDTSHLVGKTCKFSDFILVNLTDTFGSGNEPVADDYYKELRTSKMTISSQNGVYKFESITGPRGATGKTAYEYAVEGGYSGTEEEFSEIMNSSKIDIYPCDKGINVLENSEIRSLPRSEIISEDDKIISVISNPYHGDYLEAIKESTITPHVGYYVNGDYTVLVDENPSEAKYLTDALYGIASNVKGNADLPYSVINEYALFKEGVVPAAVLDLERPTVIGAVELNCKPLNRAPVGFSIEIKNIRGEWVRVVKREKDSDIFKIDGTEKFIFDPIEGTNVRVVIDYCYYKSSDESQFPQILEIVVYEAKSGRILKKVEPNYVTTEVFCDSGTVNSIIDGNRNTLFQSSSYTKEFEDGKVRPIPFEFNFYEGATISRIKIFAYHNQKHTPAKIILEAKVDGEWIELKDINGKSLGNPNLPSMGSNGVERPYTNIPLYTTELKDAAVIDLDKEYDVEAIRLYVTSVLGGIAPLVLSDVEFYGPEKADPEYSDKVGVICNDRTPVEIPGDSGYYWFFGAKVSCEGMNRGDLMNGMRPPEVVLEFKENDSTRELILGKITGEKLFEDFYYRFWSDSQASRFTDIKLWVKYYGNTRNVSDLVCKFTDITLVNLSEAYGEDVEPSAEVYAKRRGSFLMDVDTTEGHRKYIVGQGEEPPVKSVNGHTGEVILSASDIGAAPSGYGFGETYARYPDGNDLNNATTTGVYYTSYGTRNSPNTDAHVVFTLANGSAIYQMAYRYRSPNIYLRYYYSGERIWTGWSEYNPYTVRYGEAQSLTPAQQAQARANIGAISADDIPEGGDDYVKNTDYATADQAGVVKAGMGLSMVDGAIQVEYARENQIVAKNSYRNPITPVNLDVAVKTGITTNQIPLTDEEKQAAKDWLGAAGVDEYGRLMVRELQVSDEAEENGIVILPCPYEDDYAVAEFDGVVGDELVRLRRIAPGKEDFDAVTLGQLNEKLAEVGGSGIPIDTAEVGQTIVVKAVDENGKPTEWEAADLPSGGEKKTKLITLVDITAENDIIIATDDTDDLSFGDAVIGHRHFFYKTPEGKQLKAKRIYGYIYTPTATNIPATVSFMAYYKDGDPNTWNFGDMGVLTSLTNSTPRSISAANYFIFQASSDLKRTSSGITSDLSWFKISGINQSYNTMDKIFPYISGIKLSISSGSCNFVPAGGRFVLKAEVEEDA